MLSCSLSPDKGSFYKIQMNLDEKCGLVRKHEIEKKNTKREDRNYHYAKSTKKNT